MIRETSIEAYHAIRDSGLLSRRRWEIYDILFHSGPLTANEIFRLLIGRSPINQANIPARLNEMREAGCVQERGEKACEVTGRNVILWDVTASLPLSRQLSQNVRPRRQDLEKRIADLEAMLRACRCGKQMGLFS